MRTILKCPICGSYGIKELCECNSKRISVKPLKMSMVEKYEEYRRKTKYG